MGALPLIVIPHPVGQLPADTVRSYADAVVDEILTAVTRPRDEVARLYRGRAGDSPGPTPR